MSARVTVHWRTQVTEYHSATFDAANLPEVVREAVETHRDDVLAAIEGDRDYLAFVDLAVMDEGDDTLGDLEVSERTVTRITVKESA